MARVVTIHVFTWTQWSHNGRTLPSVSTTMKCWLSPRHVCFVKTGWWLGRRWPRSPAIFMAPSPLNLSPSPSLTTYSPTNRLQPKINKNLSVFLSLGTITNMQHNGHVCELFRAQNLFPVNNISVDCCKNISPKQAAALLVTTLKLVCNLLLSRGGPDPRIYSSPIPVMHTASQCWQLLTTSTIWLPNDTYF